MSPETMSNSTPVSLAMPPDTRSLSTRERQVLALLLSGISEKEVAQKLGLSVGTVHKYVTRIYRQCSVSTRAELMALWIPPPRNGRYPWESDLEC